MTTDQSDSHHPTKVLPIGPAAPFDVLPQTFGRHVLEQEIGAGGMGQGRLQHVKFNGVLLPELARAEVNDKFSPADTRDGLGIWMKMSEGTIRNAKFSLDH